MNVKEFRKIRRFFEKEKSWDTESGIHRFINYKSNMEVHGRGSIEFLYKKLLRNKKKKFLLTWYSATIRLNCDNCLTNQPRFYKVRGFH